MAGPPPLGGRMRRLTVGLRRMCGQLLDGKMSVLSVLNSQSVANTQPDDSRFVQELLNHFGSGKHPDYKAPPASAATQFTICHFAADVTYTVAGTPSESGFVSRNKDTLLPKLPALMRTSRSPFLSSLFPVREGGKGAAASRPPVAQQFRQSMATLAATLEASTQHFIRCIKPNERSAAFVLRHQRCVHSCSAARCARRRK